ncbi:AAA family ATPase [Kribbella yunnanensis]|uniref:AAA family ATPase n=1 Tax=Kribbella yunnanensis TaxID=190194 RepID=A0ABN2INF7_9ACTN
MRATVYLIVGLPGAGKTTHAKQLELEAPALRLTTDEWQILLFDYENPEDRRDLVEGKLIEIGMRTAQLGTNVILDFGFWSKDERTALRWIAAAVGARCQVVYLPIDAEEQRQRIMHRFTTTPDQTFTISDAELAEWRTVFEPPDQAELDGTHLAPAPPDHPTWSAWASHRWPSLPELAENPVT